MAHVVDVPFCFVSLYEAMPLVKAIRITAAQGTKADWHAPRVGTLKDIAQNGCANASALVLGQDI